MVEVVQHRDHGMAVFAVEHREQIEQLHLVGDVEVGGGLVEQEQRGLLRQHHGHPDALALAARELVDQPAGQLAHTGETHRVADGRLVADRPLPQQLLVRKAAACDQIGDGDAVRGEGTLGEQAQAPGDLLGVQARDVAAVEDDTAGRGCDEPGQAAQ